MDAKIKSPFARSYSFLFVEDNNEIEFWFSQFSGLELVKVNGMVISSNRSLSRNTTHEFSVGEIQYSINLNVVSMIHGPVVCTLNKDAKAYKRQRLVFRTPKVARPAMELPILLILGALVGVGFAYWDIPIGFTLLFLVVFVAVSFFTKPKEVDEQVALILEEEDLD